MGAVEEVCFTGYIMDTYCIRRGTMLDNPSLQALEHPDEHSVHCLVDIPQCVNSAFEILADTEGTNHTSFGRAYELDHAGHDLTVALARAEGSVALGCTTCDPDAGGTLQRGFRATVYGTTEIGRSPQLLSVSRVESESAGGCPGGNILPASLVFGGGGAIVPYYNAHGSCMLLGWGLLLPSGVLVAKLGKHRGPVWFKYHRAAQLTGLAFALAGWLIALSQFAVLSGPGWSLSRLHGTMGMVVMPVGLLQPLNAVLRPHKPEGGAASSGKRRAWELLHKGAGWFAASLALVTVLLGTQVATEQAAFRAAYAVALCSLVGLGVGLGVQGRRRRAAARGKPSDVSVTRQIA